MKSWNVVIKAKGKGVWSADHFYVVKAKSAANALASGLRRYESNGIAFLEYAVKVTERKEKAA